MKKPPVDRVVEATPELQAHYNIREEPGWFGQFTRNQCAGALRNGQRIVKVNSESGDATRDGSRGTVLGSIQAPGLPPNYEHVRFGYFVEWDERRRWARFILDYKLALEAS